MARVKLCTNCKEINPANRTACQKCRKDLKGRPVSEEDAKRQLEELLQKEKEEQEKGAAGTESDETTEPKEVQTDAQVLINYRQCDCGHRNPVAASFCQSCGESLEGLMILTATPEECPVAQEPAPAQQTPQLGQRVMLTSVDLILRIPIAGRVVLGAENEGSAYFYDKTYVGRCHAAITAEPDGVYIEDLNSRNGTFVNGRKLIPGQRMRMEHGSEICLGGTESFCDQLKKAAYLRLEIGV